ncbi:MAG: hypothetical protein WKG07_03425 [Hymenobacter sp.]
MLRPRRRRQPARQHHPRRPRPTSMWNVGLRQPIIEIFSSA